MEASALGALGSGSVVTALVVTIFYLLRQNHTDRTQSLGQITRMHKEHADEIARISQAHASQMEEVREQVAALESKITEALAKYEAERDLRWKAEDSAAKWRRQAEARA